MDTANQGKSENRDHDKTALISRDAFEIHRQMVAFLFAATFITVIVLSLLLWRLYQPPPAQNESGTPRPQVTALMVAAVAGALGGFVSALRRLYAFAPIFPSVNFSFWPRRSTAYVLMYSAIPPLVGAIAAVVVYLVFAGHMIKGPLFPEFWFDPKHSTEETFANFLANWQPKGATEYAKVFVWAFIAGFSEKFVPDILNRLSKSSERPDK